MRPNIWIISQYESLPSTGLGGRHRHLARELSARGYSVSLISARSTHLTRDKKEAQKAPEKEAFEGFEFVRVSINNYQHAHDKRRILSWLTFAFKVAKLHKKIGVKPDLVIYSSPSLIPFISAYYIARRFKAKLIFDVRDIWPLTLMRVGGFSNTNPLIKIMEWVERFAYRKADFVISNLEGAVTHMCAKGLEREKFKWIPNGFSEAELSKSCSVDKKVLGTLENQKFSVSYVGTVGEANSIITLLEAAFYLRDEKDIAINIFGEGRLLKELKHHKRRLGLENVYFWGAIPKKQVSEVLKLSDCCVICWKDSSLYDYGVAANKIFDYLYSGKPIINCYSGSYDLVSRYKAGVTIPAEDPKQLAKAIKNFSHEEPGRLETLGFNGKSQVKINHEYRTIARQLSCLIESLIKRD